MAKAPAKAASKTPAKKTGVKKAAARKAPAKKAPAKAARKPLPKAEPGKPVLLSGGNPQIAKGYGDAPVQAWIAASPGWKSAAAKKLDAIITRAAPKVNKAVKWNSPMYGMEEGRWFLGLHVFDRYIKVAFFKGAQLDPEPPVGSRQKEVRYFHLHEAGDLDEKQFTAWVKQASKLPGEKM